MKDGKEFENKKEDVIEYISNYVDDICEKERSAIKKVMHFSSHQKGELIHKQGQVSKRAYFLLSGAVRFFYTSEEGKDHTTNFSFENEPAFPYGSFVEQTPSGISIAALETVELIWSSKEEFNNFINEYPRFQGGIAKLLGEYLLKGSQQLSLLRIGSSRERYEKLCTMQPEVVKRVPLTHIASYLDMALETLSRVRAGKL